MIVAFIVMIGSGGTVSGSQRQVFSQYAELPPVGTRAEQDRGLNEEEGSIAPDE